MRRWNDGKLEQKYYSGIRSSQVDPSALTKYKWNFKGRGASAEKLEAMREQVDRATNKDFAMEVKVRVSAQKHIADDTRRRAPQGPAVPPPPSGSAASPSRPDIRMDDEDREQYDRSVRRKKDKQHHKSKEADLEELVPKATGRDAVIEKRRAQTAYHRMERDDGMEVPDSVLMGTGGDDSYQVRMKAQKARDDKRQQRQAVKQEVMNEKVQNYNAKEAATIEMLRQLAEANRASGTGLIGQQRR